MNMLHPLVDFFIPAAVIGVPVPKFLHLFSKFTFESFYLIATTRLGVLLNFSPHADDVSLKLFVLFGKAFAVFPIFFTAVAFSVIAFPFTIGSIAIVPFTTLVTSAFIVTIAIAFSFFLTIAIAWSFIVTLPVAVSTFFSTAFFILVPVTRTLSIALFISNFLDECRGLGFHLRFLCRRSGGFCVGCILSNRGQQSTTSHEG
jgi:hypothetical protein